MSVIYAELNEKDKCLYDAFKLYDVDMKGELMSTEVMALYDDIRFGGISLQQVQAAMEYTCATADCCVRSELMDLLQELDRRYFLIQDLRWEFSMLDREMKDTVTAERARWLMQSVHGKFFSRRKWEKFINTRPVSGSGVSFAEIEVELCNIPNRMDIEDELLEQQKELEEKEKRQKELEQAAQDERKMRQKQREEEEGERNENERKRKEAIHRIEQESEAERKRKEQEQEEEKQRAIDEQIRQKKEEDDERKKEQEEAEAVAEQQQKSGVNAEQLQQAERQAMMAENAEKEAQEDLRKAREKKAKASDEKARKEAEELERKAKEKEIENRNKKLRAHLKVAIVSEDKDQLEPAIEDFEKAKLSDPDMDLDKAKLILSMLNAKDDLKKAMNKRHLESLEKAIRMVWRLVPNPEVQLASEMAAANKLLLQLRRLERIRAEILELKQSTVAEIRSYSAPPVAVQTVMIGTFLLHGHPEKETKSWKTVQALVGKTGKEGLKRRCLEYDPDNLVKDQETAKRAAELFKKYDLDEVRDVSAGAATFYVWATSMLEEAEMRAEAAAEQVKEEMKEQKSKKTGMNKTGSVKQGQINMSI